MNDILKPWTKYSIHSNAMNIIFEPCDPLSNKKKTYLYFHHEQQLQHHHQHKKPFHFPDIGSHKTCKKSEILSLKIRKIMFNIKL